MKVLKLVFLCLTIFFQLGAFVLFFLNISTAIYFFALNIICFVILLVIIIMERIKEKEEEDDDDHSNY